MKNTKEDLLKILIEFRSNYKRFPTRKDFEDKKVEISRSPFKRKFGSVKTAIEEAEKIITEQTSIKQQGKRKYTKAHKGFQCAFCGNWIQNPEEYYSSLTKILAMRFVELLKSNNGRSYSEGVMDSVYAVFRTKNLVMKEALKSAGYLENFEQRYEKNE